MHIMIDTETWDVRPTSMIRSLGAVHFDPVAGRLGSEFYANVDEASQEALGLTQDPDTLLWWTRQDPDLEEMMSVEQRPIQDVMADFTAWWTKCNGVHPWSHGANFDEVILSNIYRALGQEPPWRFWDVRCCRTVLALGNRRAAPPTGSPRHHALVEAKAQAVAVIHAIRGRLPTAGWK